MKLLTFSDQGQSQLKLGIATSDGVIDVAATAARHQIDCPTDMMAAIAAGPGALDAVAEAAAEFVAENSITFGPCVPSPEKIICVGLNYRRHAAESGLAVPDTPVLFSKFNNALTGHGRPVTLPSNAEKHDYEVELAVVIGHKGRHVAEGDALATVFGYCTANDVSVRDLQTRTSQWLLGKTIDGGLPLGPYLVTADEITNPNNLNLTTTVNGEMRQNSNTSDLVFAVEEIIAYISSYFTLQPGDVILTGTPEGVGMGFDPPRWLKAGDTVTVEVESLGACMTQFVAE